MAEWRAPSDGSDILSYYERFDEANRLARGSGLLEVARMHHVLISETTGQSSSNSSGQGAGHPCRQPAEGEHGTAAGLGAPTPVQNLPAVDAEAGGETLPGEGPWPP